MQPRLARTKCSRAQWGAGNGYSAVALESGVVRVGLHADRLLATGNVSAAVRRAHASAAAFRRRADRGAGTRGSEPRDTVARVDAAGIPDALRRVWMGSHVELPRAARLGGPAHRHRQARKRRL